MRASPHTAGRFNSRLEQQQNDRDLSLQRAHGSARCFRERSALSSGLPSPTFAEDAKWAMIGRWEDTLCAHEVMLAFWELRFS